MVLPQHVPVMTREVVALLQPGRGGLYVDCTVGLGGHARALVEAGAARLIGLDRDADALTLARQELEPWADRIELYHADYRDLPRVLEARGIRGVDGALADLGVSSLQLEGAERGFSFRRDEPLDMRMDRSEGPTLTALLQDIDEATLADAIFQFGEERFSRRIARAIVAARETAPITTTGRLAEVVRRAVPRRGYQRIDPATRTFQALRILLNRELEGLDGFLGSATEHLLAGARLAVISFHSLEDRIVKQYVREQARGCTCPPEFPICVCGNEPVLRDLTRKPVRPGARELEANPRAASAKLRAATKVGD